MRRQFVLSMLPMCAIPQPPSISNRPPSRKWNRRSPPSWKSARSWWQRSNALMPTLRPLLLELRPVMTKPSRLSAIPTLRHSGRAKPTFIRSRLRSNLRPKRKATVWEPGYTAHLKKSCAFKMYTTRTLASPIPNLPTKRALPRAASSTNEEATFSVRTSRTAGTSSVVGTTFSGCKSSSSRFHKNLKGSFPYHRWTKLRSQQFLRRHDLVHDLSFAQTMQVVV